MVGSIDHCIGGYDLITMLNTLEHMYNPIKELEKIHNLLDDNGHLLVSVPDIWNINIKKPMDAYLSNAHLFNFSHNTLGVMLFKCKYDICIPIYIEEEIGNKLYLLARKRDTSINVGFTKPNMEALKKHLNLCNEVFLNKYSQGGYK
jgi:hypothetical protein